MNPRRRTSTQNAYAPFVRRHKPDYHIVLYMGLLMLVGLIVMYAIGPQHANVLNDSFGTSYYGSTYFFVKQILSLFISLVAFVILAYTPFKLLQRHALKLVVAGFAACILLYFFGNLLHVGSITECTLGACRWFSLGPLGSLQPSEFLKFAMLIFTAGFLGTRARQGLINDRTQTLVPLALLVLLSLGFIIGIQKDMGTGITFTAIIATQLLVAGLKWKIWLFLLAALAVVGVVFIMIAPHRIERVLTFFGNSTSASASESTDYHITHAKMAIGSGGLFGVGIGNSVEASGYLPEAINDSVFAIMGETFGFIGLVAILVLFTALLMRLLQISDALVDSRQRILVAGVFGWLGSHVLLNVGAMIGMIPLTGITLPLLSFGGTSMLFMAAALGITFQLSRYTVFGSKLKGNDHEDSQRRRGLRRARDSSRRRFA